MGITKKLILIFCSLFIPSGVFLYLNKRKEFWIYLILNVFIALIYGSPLITINFLTFYSVLILGLSYTLVAFIHVIYTLMNYNHGTTNLRSALTFSVICITMLTALYFKVIPENYYKTFKIASGSLYPNLLVEERILVIPPKLIRRGDLIIFKYPKNKKIPYIMRVIGFPEDIVEIKNKTVFINGTEIKSNPIIGDKYKRFVDEKYKGYNLDFHKTVIGEKEIIIIFDKDSFQFLDFPEVRVPRNHLFVMGDNRDFSNDSRFWGFVPIEDVEWTPKFIFYSPFWKRIGLDWK